MSEDQKRSYVIADNRLAENAGLGLGDPRHRARALAELDLDFDIGVIGFDPGEIDLIIDGARADAGDPRTTGCRTRTTGPSRGPAICGNSARTGSSAAIAATQP